MDRPKSFKGGPLADNSALIDVGVDFALGQNDPDRLTLCAP